LFFNERHIYSTGTKMAHEYKIKSQREKKTVKYLRTLLRNYEDACNKE